jgi:hypothetical protein
VNSFAFIIGKCVWLPPSPKAALAVLMLFYGLGDPGTLPATYEAAIEAQMVSAGATVAQAHKEMVLAKPV